MNKEELKRLLQENLTIDIKEESSYGTTSIDIKIKFDNDIVCSDSYYITRYLD
jgi:hypothetical protein